MAYDGRTSETANTAKTGVQRLCPIKIDSEIMLGYVWDSCTATLRCHLG
jgi:hypothetical protein